ncbi:MAG: lysylphosphatidylglycerol synthase domain-containing protein, partial [Bacteroidota bacterium]
MAPLLFAWLCYSIFRQIKNQPQLGVSWQQVKASFSSAKIFYLLVACILIFVNWGIEALKWQLSVAGIQRILFVQAYKAVLAGVTFSVSMPNRIGEYLGRV